MGEVVSVDGQTGSRFYDTLFNKKTRPPPCYTARRFLRDQQAASIRSTLRERSINNYSNPHGFHDRRPQKRLRIAKDGRAESSGRHRQLGLNGSDRLKRYAPSSPVQVGAKRRRENSVFISAIVRHAAFGAGR